MRIQKLFRDKLSSYMSLNIKCHQTCCTTYSAYSFITLHYIKTVKTVDKLQLRTIYGDTNKRP